MKSALLGVAAFVLSLTASGCNIVGFPSAVILPVTEVDAPEAISAGAPLSVSLTVQSGGCRRFDRVETDRTASGASITAWGRDGGGRNNVCTTDIRYDRVSVRFDPPFPSPFVITVGQGAMPATVVTVRVE